MNERHQRMLQDVEEAFSRRRFREASRAAQSLLTSAAAVSREELQAVARGLVTSAKLLPIFSNILQAVRAQFFFRQILRTLVKRLPNEMPTALARRNLGMLWSLSGFPGLAAEAYERALEELTRLRGPHADETRSVRDNLAIQYRKMRREHEAAALYAESGICEHLRGVEQYIRSRGVRVSSIHSPYDNAQTWVFFEGVVLDVESLMQRFQLGPPVRTHSYFDIKGGAEHGLVCDQHHDALMGGHPEVATNVVRLR